ncbi:hypothetical protein SAICODRAFT_24823 [Saitoella complicata NRRL Y-17804]|uniref:uncharacterized protein n=1 Tax=Saitoella complicata (strain BCRC 22490 / CBS 7301 / JCM 7358 / NBRC 10748 / NRRL Y-17804) TaxID=698492 RepID=UPI00086688DF|nr:uncharacterized protein SAICODRAFT_24823 [Saitoella complicata NRRL Y-17804]ODQ53587.1 hypothetical protein SAICODRAFT_24823 [Saitoella complicata NRRL Y-17804]
MSLSKLQEPVILAQLAGVVGSAVFAVGNFANSSTGVMAVLADSSTTELPLKYQLTIWRRFYERGKAFFAPTAVVSAASYGLVAYLSPALRNSALLSMGLCVTALPFTLFGIGPTNNKLFALEERAKAGETSEAFDKNALGLLNTWRGLNAIRFSLVGLGFLNGLKDLALM